MIIFIALKIYNIKRRDPTSKPIFQVAKKQL